MFVHSARTGSWTDTFGASNLATHSPMRANMHFRIGSITKTFISTIILQLMDEGKLQLNDPISKFQPEIPNGENITIREILNMTSGLYNYSEDDNFSKILDSELRGNNANKAWNPYELLSVAFKHSSYFAPGQGFHYSNTNYILLGLMIEQITGHAVKDEIQRRLFTPLGMKHSWIPDRVSSFIPAPYSQGYAFETLGQPGQTAQTSEVPLNVTQVNPAWSGTAGDAISTLDDLKIWVKTLAQGTLISQKAQREQLQFVSLGPGAPMSIKYGLGIANFHGFIGHNGSLPGFQSFATYNPEKDATVIVLTNVDPSASGTSAADRLAKIIIQNLS